jgi:hypothetical protein
MTGAGVTLVAFALAAQVDLEPTEVVPLATTFLAEDQVEFELSLSAGDFRGDATVRIWASSDATLDSADELVLEEQLAVASSTGSFQLGAPSPGPTGTFFAIADLDPADAVAESDETNNQLSSTASFNLAGIDMELERLILQTSPPLILGTTRSYRIDVVNRGPSRAMGVEIGLFLKPAGGTEEPLVPFTSIGDLPANTRDTASGTYVVPAAAAAGAAEVIARTRLAEPVRETDPSNDFEVRQVVLVDRLPNLRGEIGSAPDTAEAGSTITVQRVLENNGVADGSVATELLIVLSLDDVIEADDFLLRQETIPALARGALDVADSTLDLPLTLTSTTYRLGLVIDRENAEPETIEEDNFVVGPAIEVFPADLAIVTSTLPVARTGTAYEVALIGVGGTVSRTWSIPEDQLPPGIGLDEQEGILSGVPMERGLYPLDVELRSGSASVQRRIDLRVADPTLPLGVAQDSLPPTVAGQSYQAQLVAQGGLSPFTWSATGLPPGLSLSTGGLVAGTPSVEGDFMVTVEVEDDLGERATGVVRLLVVSEMDGVAFATESLPDAVVGQAYSARLEAVGGQPPFVFSGAGLPAGLSLSGDGVLSGTPGEVGRFRFTLSVRNQLGIVRSQAFELEVVDDDGLRVLSDVLPRARAGEAYDATLEAEGGRPPLQWQRFGMEPLPPGLALDEAGVLAGTPTTPNVYRFAVEVRDAAGRVSRAPIELRVEGDGLEDPGGGCRTSSPSSLWPVAAGGLFMGLASIARRRRRASAP